MLKERARQISLAVSVLDMLLLVGSFLAAYHLRANLLPLWLDGFEHVPLETHLWLPLVSVPLFHLLFQVFRIYDSIRTLPFSRIALGIAKPFLIAGPVLGSLVFLFQAKSYSRPIFLGFLGLYFLLLVLEKWSIKVFLNQIRRRGRNYRDILIIGVGPEASGVAAVLERHGHLGMRVIGHLSLDREARAPEVRAPLLGTVEDLPSILDGRVVDEVLFAVPAATLLSLERYIWKCEEVGVRVHLKADFISTLISRTYAGDIDGIPILTISATPNAAGLLVIKRAMDIIVALASLVILSPLLLAIAAALKTTSRGPVLHRQERIGLNGRRFVMLKFRSMWADAERRRPELERLNEASGPVFKMKNDPRVTPVGRYLRRLSLDELPQLWNVLKGDMSLVGPRPPIPHEVERYERWQRRRLSMKPGLTCLWQIRGRSEVDFEKWMKLDMEYIDNWSVGLDLKILAGTVAAVITARGAH